MKNNHNESVLRLITAGSVDDGKSTLIGRLLYDSQVLFIDQIDTINKKTNSPSDLPDFASLTDGLSAEKEQGITIDVAYRYFSTNQRKFILADTPGHEEYTRNMVTGASTADAAIILIDATRFDFNQESVKLLPQTKRHSALLKILECPHLIIAINKLDLLGYDENKYHLIIKAYDQLRKQLGIDDVYYVPISALQGDNIVYQSKKMPWYQGETLIDILSKLSTDQNRVSNQKENALFPIQRVIRQDGSTIDDFRAYQGRVEQGMIEVGQKVKILSSNKETSIKEIHGLNGLQKEALSSEVITITLNHDIDISRGDMIADTDTPIRGSKNIHAILCWLNNPPLNITRKYLLKHTTKTITIKINEILNVLDVHTLINEKKEAQELNMNDIGTVALTLQQPIFATTYKENHATGSFILIDGVSNQTIAAGLITEII